jgi:hypothetical protein
MYWRDNRAIGYLLLLYVIYTITKYIYDKTKAAYYFVLDFCSQNNDTIFWLIIAVFAACFLYLCGYMGRKKKKEKELETTKLESSDKSEQKFETISNQEMGQILGIGPASKLENEPKIEAPSNSKDVVTAVPYRCAETAGFADNMDQSQNEATSDV